MTLSIPRQRGPRPSRLVLALVGTDVHRFDRLVDWLERWHLDRAAGAPDPVRLVIQYGSSREPRIPGAAPFLAHAELQRMMAEATLVVCHGGPATITEARRTGHLPIVVPRDPTHHEHVDNHQQLFARRLGVAGMIRLCESEAELTAALDSGLADPAAFTLRPDPTGHDPRVAAALTVGQIIEGLIDRRARRRGTGARRSGTAPMVTPPDAATGGPVGTAPMVTPPDAATGGPVADDRTTAPGQRITGTGRWPS